MRLSIIAAIACLSVGTLCLFMRRLDLQTGWHKGALVMLICAIVNYLAATGNIVMIVKILIQGG